MAPETQALAAAAVLVSLGAWGALRHRDAYRAVLGAALVLPACALVLAASARAAGRPGGGAEDSMGLVLVAIAAAQVSIGLGIRGRPARPGAERGRAAPAPGEPGAAKSGAARSGRGEPERGAAIRGDSVPAGSRHDEGSPSPRRSP